MSSYSLVYFCNDAYWEYVLVSAMSAQLHTTGELVFYIVHTDVTQEHQDLMRAHLKGAECRFIALEKERYADFPAWHGSNVLWGRIDLANLMPEAEWVCLCDADTLWFEGVEALFEEVKRAPEGISILGSYDPWICGRKSGGGEDWFLRKGVAFKKDRYFCAGLFLINLNFLRKIDFTQKAKQFIAAYGFPPLLEQDIFNVICYDYIQWLPYGWGVFSRDERLGKDASVRIGLCHYVHDVPWKRRWLAPMSDLVMMWWIAYFRIFRLRNLKWSSKLYILRIIGVVLTLLPSGLRRRLEVYLHAQCLPLPLRKMTRAWKARI